MSAIEVRREAGFPAGAGRCRAVVSDAARAGETTVRLRASQMPGSEDVERAVDRFPDRLTGLLS